MLHRRTPAERNPRSMTRAPTGAAPGRWALIVFMLPLATGLAGCQDGPLPTAPAVAPTAPAVEVAAAKQSDATTKAKDGPVTAAVALEDGLTRVLPALEAGGPIAGLDTGLRQLLAQLEGDGGGDAALKPALTGLQKALDTYQAQAGEEFQPDISVLQLALDAVVHG